jgi:hypothetical protein
LFLGRQPSADSCKPSFAGTLTPVHVPPLCNLCVNMLQSPYDPCMCSPLVCVNTVQCDPGSSQLSKHTVCCRGTCDRLCLPAQQTPVMISTCHSVFLERVCNASDTACIVAV